MVWQMVWFSIPTGVKVVNNLFKSLLCIGVLFSTQMSFAGCYISSKTNKIGVGFFNGVNKTQFDAQSLMEKLNVLTKNEAELFYNNT